LDKDDIKDDLEKLKGIVNPLHFICRTCGQVAKESDSLRKAVEL
jgi:hypothetical protein